MNFAENATPPVSSTLGAMKTVHLATRDEAGNETGRIQGSFDDADLLKLQAYLELVSRLNETTLLAKGMPGISNLRFGQGGIELTAEPYSNRDLHEFLHVLRPLILEKEPHSFLKTCALLQNAFRDTNFKEHLRITRRIYDHGELSVYMQVSIGDTKLFDKSVLRTWLNGTQYHTDADKAKAWAELEADLTADNARALLIAQLRSKVIAMRDLAHVADIIVRE